MISWCQRYSLDHPSIDAQHQELFNLANRVEALNPNTVTKEEISKLFKEFYDYMREHFREEETYMYRIGYPGFQAHCVLHQGIIQAMTSILKETKEIIALPNKMKALSQKWLVEHILDHDMSVKAWSAKNEIDLDNIENFISK